MEIKFFESGIDIFAVTAKGVFLINPESGEEYQDFPESGLPDDATEIHPGHHWLIPSLPEEIK